MDVGMGAGGAGRRRGRKGARAEPDVAGRVASGGLEWGVKVG